VTQPAATWTVGAVARRLGVAPATLRTWDRRYGLGPSEHRAGAHRRYTEADVARLRRMADLLRQGVATADAAALAAAPPVAATAAPPIASPAAPPAVPVAGPPAATDAGSPNDPEPASPAGGGRVATAQRWRRGLNRAAVALDAPTLLRRVESALARRGVVTAWEDLLRPVVAHAGMRWELTGEGVDIEHVLSDCIASALATAASAAPPPYPVPPVLLACAADELHALPLHVLRAALRERRVPVQLLGAATPPDALADAVRRVGPSSVVVWSQLPATADAALLAAVPVMRPRPRVYAAGPGWGDAGLPPGVVRLTGLPAAVDELEDAAGVGTGGPERPATGG
jgi:DNA-binding transcriptional MerR regulator